MNALLFAAETASHDPAGDDFFVLSMVMLGATMLVAAVATWIVTPKGEEH